MYSFHLQIQIITKVGDQQEAAYIRSWLPNAVRSACNLLT
jgi:hypothetical protein